MYICILYKSYEARLMIVCLQKHVLVLSSFLHISSSLAISSRKCEGSFCPPSSKFSPMSSGKREVQIMMTAATDSLSLQEK